MRGGRATALVRNDVQAVALGHQPQDRFDEILTIGAVNPRCAQNDMPRIGADAVLPRELAATIGSERRRLILLHIGKTLSPVEHIIGRDMNEGASHDARSLRQVATAPRH